VVGEVISGRYELEELLGSGGMSSVFRARDRLLDRHVALKVLHARYSDDDEHVARFRREARTVARLSHPHIVTVIDRGVDEGRQFIVFEHVQGENLKELVRRSGPLPAQRAVALGLAVAEGLAFAHAQGLVHRDVKPQNILLDEEGEVKVTDFGIARSLDVDRGLTQAGTVLGTSEYISPEQAGGGVVTPATDIYSLGIVLWELLTGAVPFSGDSFMAVALRHVNEQPPSLLDVRPDAPPRLAAAVDRALAKNPADRFPSMQAFAQELRLCLDDLDSEQTAVGMALPPLARIRPRRRTGRRRPIAIGVLLVAAVAAIVVGSLALRGSGTSGPGGSTSGGQGTPPGGTAGVRGVTSYDPQGNGQEHSASAPNATDGDPTTYWYTETYKSRSFGGLKDGVGLVLDAGESVRLESLTVSTTTPGFQAAVLTGDSETGRFATSDSAVETVGPTTTFTLEGATARYYCLWITELPPGGVAKIAEVTASP
jgi:tRNA A-37 threonylcarbamoyl transferase component Bud32